MFSDPLVSGGPEWSPGGPRSSTLSTASATANSTVELHDSPIQRLWPSSLQQNFTGYPMQAQQTVQPQAAMQPSKLAIRTTITIGNAQLRNNRTSDGTSAMPQIPQQFQNQAEQTASTKPPQPRSGNRSLRGFARWRTVSRLHPPLPHEVAEHQNRGAKIPNISYHSLRRRTRQSLNFVSLLLEIHRPCLGTSLGFAMRSKLDGIHCRRYGKTSRLITILRNLRS